MVVSEAIEIKNFTKEFSRNDKWLEAITVKNPARQI